MFTWVIGFFWVGGFVPPPSPANSAAQVVEQFRENTLRIQIGLSITSLGGALIGPWVAGLSTYLRRLEGRNAPLSRAQLALGCLLPVEFLVPIFTWQTAAFRSARWDTDPELIRALNDLAWLPFMGVVYTAILQCLITALLILRDNRAQPLFPRWAGYLNVLAAMGICPGGLVVFFHTGPFAWNGVMSFYVVVASFCIWIITMSVLMLRSSHLLDLE